MNQTVTPSRQCEVPTTEADEVVAIMLLAWAISLPIVIQLASHVVALHRSSKILRAPPPPPHRRRR